MYSDRTDAGRRLGHHLKRYAGRGDVLVLALPRGGVPVGSAVASALGAPLDVFIVRKLGVPGHTELAMGAVATGGVRVLNDDTIRRLDIPEHVIDELAAREWEEVRRRDLAYRAGRPEPDLLGRCVILVDDGLATGSTMLAAVRAVRQLGPCRVVVAVPVGPEETCERLRAEADEVVCLQQPRPFFAVGSWYQDFTQTDDDEVRHLLARALGTTKASPDS